MKRYKSISCLITCTYFNCAFARFWKNNFHECLTNKYFLLLIQDASLASPANSDPTRVGATSPTKLDSPKIRSDEDVETLQLTKKEKKTSLEEKPAEIKIETPRESVSEEKTEEEKPAEPVAEPVAEPEKPVETEPEKPVEAEPEKPAETENPPPAEPEETKENGNAEE